MRSRLVWVVAVAAVLVPVSPTAAADGQIGLSSDGTTFGPELALSLFDPDVLWVPGDVRGGTFYVRNQGGSPAEMSIDLVGDEPSPLIDSGALTITARAGDAAPVALAGATARRLLQGRVVDDDEVVPVTIQVAYDGAADNDTQLVVSDLGFGITLSGLDQGFATISADGSPADRSDDDGLLPDTGAPSFLVSFLVASLCLGAGVALLVRRPHLSEGHLHG